MLQSLRCGRAIATAASGVGCVWPLLFAHHVFCFASCRIAVHVSFRNDRSFRRRGIGGGFPGFRIRPSAAVQKFKMTTGNEPETQTQGLDSHQLGYGGNNEKEIYMKRGASEFYENKGLILFIRDESGQFLGVNCCEAQHLTKQ